MSVRLEGGRWIPVGPDSFNPAQRELPDEGGKPVEVFFRRAKVFADPPDNRGTQGIIDTLTDHTQGAGAQGLRGWVVAQEFHQDGNQDNLVGFDVYFELNR